MTPEATREVTDDEAMVEEDLIAELVEEAIIEDDPIDELNNVKLGDEEAIEVDEEVGRDPRRAAQPDFDHEGAEEEVELPRRKPASANFCKSALFEIPFMSGSSQTQS